MPASLFIAKLLGAVFVLVGIALLLKTQNFRAIVEEFIRGSDRRLSIDRDGSQQLLSSIS